MPRRALQGDSDDMPTTKSAKKRMKTSAKRNLANKSAKTLVATLRRRLNEALTAGNDSLAKELLPKFTSALDKAAKKGTIKSNSANRRKARASLKVLAPKA
jgi:small subunit ribosomal protein S20